MLRLWPDDNQILQILNNSYQLAHIIIHNEESLSINRRYEHEIKSETSEGDESDIPAVLNEVSVIMKHGSAEIFDSDYSDLIFNEGQFQLKRINEKPNNLSIINGGDSVNNKYQFLLDDNLNFESLNSSNSIMPNKASNLVSFFSKNEDPNQCFQSLIEIPDIENANVSRDVPLIKGNYVFVKYRNQMCIGQIIAIYYEAYSNHCFANELITTLDDISYISLHVYIPIHLDLFSDIVQEGCYILTHHLAFNIFYHILPSGILIEGNILKLLGNKKKYYFEYFGRKDIIEKIL
ncbi:hypothetical protein RhiirA5_436954 [Rhizophagus irregularis]|uniref:Uncharacterized protein n=1 Tax=Rhizophagus irregularis TaxID=588596 RepID=A0A2N0NL65_9GLOM|nr:hypothetical protein RhiirA5_436954 [Rhizophagus irregularis]